MTRDIDIVVELTNDRIDEFLTLFPDSYFQQKHDKRRSKTARNV